MPPFIPKKRLAATPPPDKPATPRKKQKVTEDSPNAGSTRTPAQKIRRVFSLDSDDSDSSLSTLDSDAFEDVPSKVTEGPAASAKRAQAANDDSDDSDEIEWENAIHHQPEQYVPKEPAKVTGGVKFSIDADDDEFGGFAAASNKKKQGLSKTERETRIASHQLHVQFLLWHNAVRNCWISDKEVQRILMEQLPGQIKREVEKWSRASGLGSPEKPKKKQAEKSKSKKSKPINIREERDWGRPSQRLEEGKADLSSGDPLISLLKVLSAYWNKRFAVTAPGLRKRGYSTRLERRKEVNSYKNDPHDPEKHGERIQSLREFREVAKKSEGSRDVGAQLFTALLRGLGIEARLVASLQPAGFGATKAEEMAPKRDPPKPPANVPSSSEESEPNTADIETINSTKKKRGQKTKRQQTSRQAKGKPESPINLDTESDSVSESADESVVDVTPTVPKKRPARYDREVPYPIYWTEAISPITCKVYPTSPLVLEKPVATNDEMLGNFEPRGAKADKVRLVIAYVVAYSSDGTAKDVTVRYLRKHIWPGKTKASRFPIEQIPIYDKRGKIQRYEDYDWFKFTLSPYVRSDHMRTGVDDVEDANELVPQEPEKKQVDNTIDTLSSLKASADFVLERFLRREEALRPGAEPDRMFTSGKGDNLKEEPVYRRADVERCLTTESWHKEGRIPKLGEVPLKRVPVRAVTLTRKREAEEHERVTGEKQLQGLYSWDQTEYIIPPPIRDGLIPKNSFGNIDAFVPTMIPKGASHIPMRGTVRICKKLGIDFAEAVVGFEFGNKRAVPVIQGVVVAKENEKAVREAWLKWNEEQKKKEEAKLEKLVLDMWRKFVVGLRIRKRVQEQYGEDVEVGSGSELPAKLKMGQTRDESIDLEGEYEGGGGGFLPDASAESEAAGEGGGGFLLPHSDEELSEREALIVEGHDEADFSRKRKGKGKRKEDSASAQYPTPASMPLSTSARPSQPAGQLAKTNRSDSNAQMHSDRGESKPSSALSSEGEAEASNHSDASSNDEDPIGSSSAPEDSSEEEYNPMSKRRGPRTPATTALRTRGRLTRSGGTVQDKPSVTGKQRANVEVVVPSKPQVLAQTPSRHGKKTEATSPYFEPSSTGRSRRSQPWPK
ncbi:uncharacterized protein HMPREF1541_00920 [Cyphellophora europaea CBS 101466]|uniref:Rad4 beta-hairpin domain-containing protein n=1 Tax=Cyphellophora europaea (strain CBS 101466) TaxID=1220924 RepID=W2SDC4_CYPE1|nr:uncharacterized protein HMPREF1541_00920 [Cyphellophora europaea CBS 101466]ETN46731.1 hypothetical protein HMPREF1541_00920 [Cyphellophora europaea CBS 101466]